mmetsp:Transcript_99595/g.304473  ORF Transcript_99595/g.304473 Transcript_99595/m.304473 type:complete len:259 (-) Transcript_99595:3-779(-)
MGAAAPTLSRSLPGAAQHRLRGVRAVHHGELQLVHLGPDLRRHLLELHARGLRGVLCSGLGHRLKLLDLVTRGLPGVQGRLLGLGGRCNDSLPNLAGGRLRVLGGLLRLTGHLHSGVQGIRGRVLGLGGRCDDSLPNLAGGRLRVLGGLLRLTGHLHSGVPGIRGHVLGNLHNLLARVARSSGALGHRLLGALHCRLGLVDDGHASRRLGLRRGPGGAGRSAGLAGAHAHGCVGCGAERRTPRAWPGPERKSLGSEIA